MAINVTISNKLERLAESFAQDVSCSKKDIFAKDIVVVQVSSLKKWLSILTAHKNNVFANVDFLSPNEFCGRIILKKLDNHYEDSLYQQGNMKWLIYNALQGLGLKSDRHFEAIFDYIHDDKLKLLHFANVIADLYDQYFIYRQDLIEAWNNGQDYAQFKDDRFKEIERWQKKLFLKLKEEVSEHREWQTGAKFFHDRVLLKNELLKQLESGNQKLIESIKAIGSVSFFGLSVITRYHYEIIKAISKYIDCNFYLLNPSGEYWYDLESDKFLLRRLTKSGSISKESLKSENDFLAQYGRNGQEFFSILFEDDEVLNNLQDEFEDNFEETTLGYVQSSLFHVTPTKKSPGLDNSIRISSCYTPFREVEVLYDNLLELFEMDKDLKPSDVLVMCTDVERYAPYMEAIFREKGNGHYIPFSIAEKSYKGGDTPIDTMLKVLELSKGVAQAEEVLGLVEDRYIARKYGFTDTQKLREIVKAASIRWALNKEQLEKEGIYEYNYYQSWEYGLKRIVYGYAMQGEVQINDLLPIDIVEGAEALEGLKLYGLIKDINIFLNRARGQKSLKDWYNFFLEMFDTFLALDNDQAHYRDEFEKILIYYAHKDIQVPFHVIRDDLSQMCSNTYAEGNFYKGGLTFCSMIPMRSIPHKVVAILGLDEFSFPNRKKRISFDIMQDQKRKGDRDPKLSSRYLFLESVISAKKYFYLSYVGKNPKTGEDLNPSSAIDDFIIYLSEITGYDIGELKENLVTEYPLHGYGREYRSGELKTYIKSNALCIADTENSTVKQAESLALDNSAALNIKDIIDFFKNSCKWYANNVLKINYVQDELLLPGEEKFNVDNLDKWKFKDRWVLGEENITEKMQKNEGNLPLGELGHVISNKIKSEVEIVKDAYKRYTAGKEKKIAYLEYKLNENTDGFFSDLIEGEVELFDSCFVGYSVSKLNGKYLLAHYVKHLFIQVCLSRQKSFFIDSQGSEYTFKAMHSEEAQEKIAAMLDIIREGIKEPFPFAIDMAFAFNKEQDIDLKKLNNSWKEFRDGNYFKNKPPDIYAQRIFSDFEYDNDLLAKFSELYRVSVAGINESIQGESYAG